MKAPLRTVHTIREASLDHCECGIHRRNVFTGNLLREQLRLLVIDAGRCHGDKHRSVAETRQFDRVEIDRLPAD